MRRWEWMEIIINYSNGLKNNIMLFLQLLLLPYLILFLAIWIKTRKKEKNEIIRSTDQYTKDFISIIIPVRNESAGIELLLKDISELNYPAKDYEIIIADDNSKDDSIKLAGSFSQAIPNMSIIQNEGRGKKKAIYTALKKARGELIISIDGDCRIQNDWLSEISRFNSLHKPDMIIGAVDYIPARSFISKFVQLDFLCLQATTEAFARWGQAVLCNGANLAFRKPDPAIYLKMVKPDIPSGDDVFLLESFRKEKKNIYWNGGAKAVINTRGPETLAELFAQRVRWSSKSLNYTNPNAILLSITVLITNLLIITSLALGLYDVKFLILGVLFYLWKAIPDFLIIKSMTMSRKKTGLLAWFIPSAIIYPFYVLLIAATGLSKGLFSLLQSKSEG